MSTSNETAQEVNAFGANVQLTSQIEKSITGLNRARENAIYREKHEASKPTCEIKLIIEPRNFGIRGHGGIKLSASAARLAIDTGVRSSVGFERSDRRSGPKVKPVMVSPECSSEYAVEYLNTFEKKYGGKHTRPYASKVKVYTSTKAEIMQALGIETDNTGKMLYKDEAQEAAYYAKMEPLGFSYYDVYLVVRPQGGRATSSKRVRVLNLEELRYAFPEFTFEVVES